MKGDVEQQRGLGEDWQRIVVDALNVRWNEMHQPDWEQQARILEAKRRSEAQHRRKELEYWEMERRRRLEDQRRREEEWKWLLRWQSQQRELEQQQRKLEEQQRKLDEQRKVEAKHQIKAEELQQKEAEQRRKDKELTGMAEELRKMAEKLRRVEEELHKEHERHRVNHNTSIVDMQKSVQRPGSPYGPSRDRERPSSSRSRASTDSFVEISSAVGITPQDPPRAETIAYRNKRDEEKWRWTNQPIVDTAESVRRPGPSRGLYKDSEHKSSGHTRSLTSSVVKLSNAVGITLQLRKSPGQPDASSSTSSEHLQERPRSSGPTSDPLVRPSGRHTLHIPSAVRDSESPRAERSGFTNGGRTYRLTFK